MFGFYAIGNWGTKKSWRDSYANGSPDYPIPLVNSIRADYTRIDPLSVKVILKLWCHYLYISSFGKINLKTFLKIDELLNKLYHTLY